MLFVQPKSDFGDLVCEELAKESTDHTRWKTFEFAVAWLNRSGARKIYESARHFLEDGGSIRATVGLDFGSTTYEALSTFLDLEEIGADITTNVFHDENPACTFHPKIFLFHNSEHARLFVGSNNMTGAGLGTNMEAALAYFGDASDTTIREAQLTLAAWRDDKNYSRTRRLTRTLLDLLRDRGYVLTESELRSRRKAEVQFRSSKGTPLFGRSKTATRRGRRSPPGQGIDANVLGGSTPGEALLMRVRPRRNGGQLQISMLLHESVLEGKIS